MIRKMAQKRANSRREVIFITAGLAWSDSQRTESCGALHVVAPGEGALTWQAFQFQPVMGTAQRQVRALGRGHL